MKLDEFAFVNHQLAGMIRAGIPLEGALRQTCQTMNAGALRGELSLLEADLARGAPLREALASRKLPGFYTRMMEIGAQGSDLPALLTLLADYYQRLHLTWVRLKGLVFYPGVVLIFSFVVSLLVAVLFGQFSEQMFGSYSDYANGVSQRSLSIIYAGLWVPVVLLSGLLAAVAAVAVVPRWREAARWRLPGFKEARLSHLASSLALLLQNGATTAQALGLVRQLEADSPAGPELAQWQQRLAEGHTRFEDMAAGTKVIPPLFVWLVAASRENWVDGFRHAAQVYYERAVQRAEVLLYAVLPFSVLLLGFVIIGQLIPIINVFSNLVRGLVSFGEM